MIVDKKRTVKDWFEDKKAWAGRKAEAANVWLGENKELVKEVAPLVILSVLGISSRCIKTHNKKKTEREQRRTIYDYRNGHRYYLKKEPKAREWGEIDRRHERGERYYDILTDMRMI